jgi:hypothetical protein
MNESKELSDMAASLFRHGGKVDEEYIRGWMKRSKTSLLPFHDLLALQTILLRMTAKLPEGTVEFLHQCVKSDFVELRINVANICDRALGEKSDQDERSAYLCVLHDLANDGDETVRSNAELALKRHKEKK